jgi:hypothetical protein
VVGPTLREEAIVYDEVRSVADLPAGWTDEQGGGTYRLRRRDDDALFGYAVGPHSWKQFLVPPRTLLMRARRDEEGFALEENGQDDPAFASSAFEDATSPRSTSGASRSLRLGRQGCQLRSPPTATR